MHISSIRVWNLRNLANVAVTGLPSAAVVVGENNSGKSNLLFGLRLVLDPALGESARQLRSEDFWDGLASPFRGAEISIVVELTGFDADEDAKAVLADSMVAVNPYVARLTYVFRPSGRRPAVDSERDDYEFLVFGGTDESNRIGPDVRRLVFIKVLPALRDAEGDLASWARSPLRTLLESLPLTDATLEELTDSLTRATESLLRVDLVRDLERVIVARVEALAGSSFDPGASLGIGPSRPDQLTRAVRLFVESGRSLGSSGLGTANLVFLALLLESIAAERAARDIVSSFVAVEEPEAHLHPHLQRALFRYLLRAEPELVVTTHSPQLASVAPIRSLVLLRRTEGGSTASTVNGAGLTENELLDMERYLDAVRADFLFCRAAILVEGPSELYLLPAYARSMGLDFDQMGVTCCSVHGTNFSPYTKLLGVNGLGIPFVVVTDGDRDISGATGFPGLVRGARLLDGIERANVESDITTRHYVRARRRLSAQRICVGESTIETDIARVHPQAVIAAYNELNLSALARQRFRRAVRRCATPAGRREVVNRIETGGKGRFAQRLAAHVRVERSPEYIRAALERVVEVLR